MARLLLFRTTIYETGQGHSHSKWNKRTKLIRVQQTCLSLYADFDCMQPIRRQMHSIEIIK
jgi:hypothetical protein